MRSIYLESIVKQMEFYKSLAEKTFNQLDDQYLFWSYNSESNSIALIVKHLSGNMLSRWTDFLTSDGEKEWRNRDNEFEIPAANRVEMMQQWEIGWDCLFSVLKSLNEDDLSKIIYIRNQGHSVIDAINRQLAHYSYHIGQIVYIGKMVCNTSWSSLSIPKGKSSDYNIEKFSVPKSNTHFTDEFLK